MLIGKSIDPVLFGKEVFNGALSWVEEKKYLEKVVRRYIPEGIPVIANIPCSHTFPMITLPLGKWVRVDTDAGTIRIENS